MVYTLLTSRHPSLFSLPVSSFVSLSPPFTNHVLQPFPTIKHTTTLLIIITNPNHHTQRPSMSVIYKRHHSPSYTAYSPTSSPPPDPFSPLPTPTPELPSSPITLTRTRHQRSTAPHYTYIFVVMSDSLPCRSSTPSRTHQQWASGGGDWLRLGRSGSGSWVL